MPASAKKVTALSVFADRSRQPTAAQVKEALESAASAWAALVAHVHHLDGAATEAWNYAGAKFGWSLRLRQKERVLLYLIPQSGQFLVGIVLGGKAVAAAQTSNLPPSVLQAIVEAPRYAEGTGLRLPVSDETQLSAVHTLLSLKLTAS